MLKPIKLISQPNKYLFRVLEDYVVEYAGMKIVVPAGFETDLATVPRIFFSIFPPDGKYKEAAVVHDFLLSTKVLSRRKCDKIFFGLIRESNVGIIKAWTIYLAVRTFSKIKRYI